MARKRNQRTGPLREKCGSWLFQWRETVIGKDGRRVRKIFAKTIAPARGRDGLSKREAQRIAKVTILDKLDETEIRPSTLMTVAEFYKVHFEPEWVWTLRPERQAALQGHLGKDQACDRRPAAEGRLLRRRPKTGSRHYRIRSIDSDGPPREERCQRDLPPRRGKTFVLGI